MHFDLATRIVTLGVGVIDIAVVAVPVAVMLIPGMAVIVSVGMVAALVAEGEGDCANATADITSAPLAAMATTDDPEDLDEPRPVDERRGLTVAQLYLHADIDGSRFIQVHRTLSLLRLHAAESEQKDGQGNDGFSHRSAVEFLNMLRSCNYLIESVTGPSRPAGCRGESSRK